MKRFMLINFSKITCLSLVLFFINWTYAGNENSSLGARSASLSGASCALQDLWSAQNNQAGLAFVDSIQAGIYIDRKFMLSELSQSAFAVALPRKSGTFGIVYSRFGYSKYNENKAGISYAKKLGNRISAGIQLNYMNKFIGNGYGNNSAVTAELGIQAMLLKGLTVAAHLFNPTRTQSAEYNQEKIPTLLKLGVLYAFSDKVFWAIESEKDIDYKARFKSGIEYKAFPQACFRIGIATQPVETSFGFGLNLSKFNLDVAAAFHQQLGFTPHLGLSYCFAK